MSAWIYRKPEASHVRGVCVLCHKKPQRRKGNRFQALCRYCDVKRFLKKWIKPGYGKYKKDECERCGFKALDRCQLDVHHKDGNHRNNDPPNLETLCANCHRLEHKKSPRSRKTSRALIVFGL